MEERYMEVQYDIYCKTCEHERLPEEDEPCRECLDNPLNLYTTQPINWVEKTNTTKVVEKKKSAAKERAMYPNIADLK